MRYRAVPLISLLGAALDTGFDTLEARAADGFVCKRCVRPMFHGLDGAEVERFFRQHALMLSRIDAGEDVESWPVVAIDGKTLRGSFDAFNDRKAAHVLSAFAADDALILGHLEVEEKSNEIPAAQQMIEALALEGRVFTMDAMHCQKNFCGGPQGKKPSACSS